MNEQHLFALFCKDLFQILSGRSVCQVEFSDRDLWQRITKVLRLRVGEKLLLFDEHVNTVVTVLEKTFIKKELVVLFVESVNSNQALKPNITLMPCLLKKDAFEDIIYASAQMGVNKIIPILSDKVQRSWGEKKERERLFNIMVAACEQSKNFFLPKIYEPVKIQDIAIHLSGDSISQRREFESGASLKVYFDPAGSSFVDLLEKIKAVADDKVVTEKDITDLHINLFFGPEGGLTVQEEKLLSDLDFETYSLTPTILRAREAVIVGLGGVRSAK